MGQAEEGKGGLALRSVESGGLRHEISDILREAIWQGVLKPGQRLNEQALSSEMGVSRPPLREAIRVLEQEGLVVSLPRRGTFVRTLTGHDVYEIYAIRCALEGVAAEMVMGHASEEQIDELDQMIDRVEWPPEDHDLGSVMTHDLAFHRLLVSLAMSDRLLGMWDQLQGQIRLALTLVDPAFFSADFVELTHRPLVEAIRRKDKEEAWRLTRALLEVGRSLSEGWDEKLAGDSAGASKSPSPAANSVNREE